MEQLELEGRVEPMMSCVFAVRISGDGRMMTGFHMELGARLGVPTEPIGIRPEPRPRRLNRIFVVARFSSASCQRDWEATGGEGGKGIKLGIA
jgi:hypothetical protein